MDMFDWGPALRVGREKVHKTLTEETLARLRHDIVSGEFAAGAKVKSEELKKRYQVGTSPIREALFQLVSDGLVRSDGQRGFRVAELRAEELLDITDWRARLECEALRRSVRHGDVEWEANVVAAYHRLKRVEADTELDHQAAADLWEEHHRAFHFALYRACGSPWLLRFCELLIEHGERYRRAYITYPRITASISEEHAAIMEAAMAREGERAAELLEKHIRHAAELALSHATKGAPRPSAPVATAEARKAKRKA